MNAWILVMYIELTIGGGVNPISVDYMELGNKVSCEYALERIDKGIPEYYVRNLFCIPKDMTYLDRRDAEIKRLEPFHDADMEPVEDLYPLSEMMEYIPEEEDEE